MDPDTDPDMDPDTDLDRDPDRYPVIVTDMKTSSFPL
jgi:hypothetical protein